MTHTDNILSPIRSSIKYTEKTFHHWSKSTIKTRKDFLFINRWIQKTVPYTTSEKKITYWSLKVLNIVSITILWFIRLFWGMIRAL